MPSARVRRGKLRNAGPERGLHQRAGEDGFTLVELLVALVILPLVVGGLTVMMLSVFRMQNGVSNRLTGSIDTQASSALMIRDVQNAAFLTTSATPSCGSTGTQILGLKSQGNQVYVAYDVVAKGSYYYLVRFGCSGGNTTTPVSQTTLAYDVPSNQTVTVTCASTITCTTAVTSTSWISTAGILLVNMSVTEPTTGTLYSVSAVPRQWNNAGAGLSINPFPIAPIILLSSGTCPQTVISSPSGSSHVYAGGVGGNGPIVDDSPCSPSVVLGGTSSIVASSLAVANPVPANALSVGSSSSAPAATYQAPTGDPFASMVAPTLPSTAVVPSCPLTNTYVGNCTPGDYTSALTISHSANVTFTAGTYVFEQPVSIIGSTTVLFDSGTYYFKGGLSISNGANVTFDTGTYIYHGSTATSNALSDTGNGTFTTGPGGVMFYVNQGTVDFANGATVSMSGMPGYDGIALWDPASTLSNPITLGGGSATNAAYGGIYAPNGEVTTTNGAVFSAAFIVTNSLVLSGNASVYAG